MKKQFRFNELSDKVCRIPKCRKKIKTRLVQNKPTVKFCYSHWAAIERARKNPSAEEAQRRIVERGTEQ